MSDRYTGTHRTQYDGSQYANANCGPTSAANGARCSTGGRIDKGGGDIRKLVARTEELNPANPGWALADIDLAMSRLGVPFHIETGGWAKVATTLAGGRFIVLNGDSDQFANNTCSGAFDGDHAVGVHPNIDAQGRWLLGDPICHDWRWEDPVVLRRYAEKLAGGTTIRFGVFDTPVPVEELMIAKVTRTPWPGGNATFRIPAGATISGYDPAKPGAPVKTNTWTKASQATASARAFVTWSGTTNPPIPKGGPFLEVIDGYYAGLLIVEAKVSVTPPPDPTPYSQADLDRSRSEGVAAGAKTNEDKWEAWVSTHP